MQVLKINDKKLLIRLKNGDGQAFFILFNLYRSKLLCFLFRMTGSIEDAEDIVQDTFIKIWSERETLDKINNLNAYIFKVAQNRMLEMLRKFPPNKIFPLDSDSNNSPVDETPENIFLKQEKQLIFQKAIDRLSLQQKNIYILHYEQEKLLKDIAKELNISLSAVQNAINKANKNMLKYIEKFFFLSMVVFCLVYASYI
jgi:RNA polymerase sigma-70 factor (ECF subfamily)